MTKAKKSFSEYLNGRLLKPAVIVALGIGMRLGEQLRMKRIQVDFLRNIFTARKTKNGRLRDIPMNDEVRETVTGLVLRVL